VGSSPPASSGSSGDDSWTPCAMRRTVENLVVYDARFVTAATMPETMLKRVIAIAAPYDAQRRVRE
jgi:hypothetical protein